MPTVSVIVPTYNRATLLERALASVRAQTYRDWEVIIVDDHSDDDTAEVVAGFNEARFRFVQFHSPGVIAAARNHGIRLACGEIVAFLDSDDLWYPTKLERCLASMTPDVDLVAHGLVYVKDNAVWGQKRCGPAERATFERLLYEGTCITTSATMVRKCALDAVSGFIEDPIDLVRDFREGKRSADNPVHVGSEDYDLWLRLAKSGARFVFVDDMLGVYLLHSGNSSRAIRSIIDSQLAVLERHFATIPCDTIRERLRRSRRVGLMFYAVARSLQDEGRRIDALKLFWEAARRWPLIPKLYAAVVLTVCGWPPAKAFAH